ncbi:MAG: hypothetical protein A2V88_02150 [Elusimicrobia bacterium RBG_16_66_12]|nr:MAG: hypothetical protein A2V88_02150 [Elusimicrobia bacterium RBG_16_66_12]
MPNWSRWRWRSRSRKPPDACGAATRRFNHDLKGGGSSVFVQKEADPWRQLLRLVAAEYPYCTMYGVNIADGNIVSCQNIQRSLLFGPEGARSSPEPVFDEYWEALKELCGKVKAGTLIELHFNQSRPVSARKSEGGRRFRRLLRKPNEGQA